MRVKIFYPQHTVRGMERDINKWMADNPSYVIQKVTQSESAAGVAQSLTVCIWYNEK